MTESTKTDMAINNSNLVVGLLAFLLGWFLIPLTPGSTGIAIFVIIGALIFVLRLIGRKNAIWAIIGIVIGIVIAILVPSASSSSIIGDHLVRAFLCLWLACTL